MPDDQREIFENITMRHFLEQVKTGSENVWNKGLLDGLKTETKRLRDERGEIALTATETREMQKLVDDSAEFNRLMWNPKRKHPPYSPSGQAFRLYNVGGIDHHWSKSWILKDVCRLARFPDCHVFVKCSNIAKWREDVLEQAVYVWKKAVAQLYYNFEDEHVAEMQDECKQECLELMKGFADTGSVQEHNGALYTKNKGLWEGRASYEMAFRQVLEWRQQFRKLYDYAEIEATSPQYKPGQQHTYPVFPCEPDEYKFDPRRDFLTIKYGRETVGVYILVFMGMFFNECAELARIWNSFHRNLETIAFGNVSWKQI